MLPLAIDNTMPCAIVARSESSFKSFAVASAMPTESRIKCLARSRTAAGIAS
jgi:hypothetical protein